MAMDCSDANSLVRPLDVALIAGVSMVSGRGASVLQAPIEKRT